MHYLPKRYPRIRGTLPLGYTTVPVTESYDDSGMSAVACSLAASIVQAIPIDLGVGRVNE